MHRINTRTARITPSVLLAPLILCLASCGHNTDGPARVPVEGEVTFHGQPLHSGSILFIPTSGTTGPRTGATIESGRYRLDDDRGPVVGTLRVEIRAAPRIGYDITEPTETVKHIGEPLPRNEIPPQYNDNSVLTVTTTAAGDNQFDFHLPQSE